MKTKDEDFVQSVIIANTHNYLMLFTNMGRVFMKKCYEIPEASKNSKGMNLVNIIELDKEEKVTAYLSIEDFKACPYLTMITKNGIIKRTLLESYKNIRRSGLIAINLDEGDELLYVLRTDGNSDVLLATHNGFAVHFDESAARALGRTARGVKAINLQNDDYVVGALAVTKDDERHVLFISENGYGKRSSISEFPVHNRGGKGVTCHKVNDKVGKLAGIAAVSEDDDVMLITNTGMIIRTRASEISIYSRTATGVRVMRLGDENMKIVSFTRVDKQEQAEENAEETAETGEGEAVVAESAEAPADATASEE